VKKGAHELNITFSKKKFKWPKTHEEMLNVLGHQKMQIKIMLRFYLTPVRMNIIKRTTTNNVGELVKKMKSHSLLVGM
jgi:hypothetical protein